MQIKDIYDQPTKCTSYQDYQKFTGKIPNYNFILF